MVQGEATMPRTPVLWTVQGTGIVRRMREAQLDKAAKRADAVNFNVALANRNRQNSPCHHGWNVVRNVLFEE
ncbi:hypothetical protein HAX54_050615, partial [Datura stramonium]|nr:hypothetical protein [Datura stramonium]